MTTDAAEADAMRDDPPLPDLAKDFRRLRAVSSILDQGSAGRAAQALHVSPSALARSVRDLDQSLALALFERSAQGMAATAEGKIWALV